mgnify:CR=1 FL=1
MAMTMTHKTKTKQDSSRYDMNASLFSRGATSVESCQGPVEGGCCHTSSGYKSCVQRRICSTCRRPRKSACIIHGAASVKPGTRQVTWEEWMITVSTNAPRSPGRSSWLRLVSSSVNRRAADMNQSFAHRALDAGLNKQLTPAFHTSSRQALPALHATLTTLTPRNCQRFRVTKSLRDE